MPKMELPKPAIISWPMWKALLLVLAVGGSITSLSWLFKMLWEPGHYLGFNSSPPSFPSLTLEDILLGGVGLPLSLWSRWAWKPRRKHARWHRWLARLASAIYVCALLLLFGISCWNTLLNRPWNWAANSVLAILFVVAWTLPLLSYSAAKRIARAQETLDLRMLSCGGAGSLMVLGGILGASFGMHAFRNGETTSALLVMGLLSSLVAVFLAQYNAEHLWPYRPWAKEEE